MLKSSTQISDMLSFQIQKMASEEKHLGETLDLLLQKEFETNFISYYYQ